MLFSNLFPSYTQQEGAISLMTLNLFFDLISFVG